MNKKQQILSEAKRLFGQYGYLGFTLKQLAKACDMTSPALYYFYTSKAELFKDCLLSELEARNAVVRRCAEKATSLAEFTRCFTAEAIDVCEASSFRTGQAMTEIIHLPAEMQSELRAAWDENNIKPLEAFLERVKPAIPANVSYYLLGTYIINMATFAAYHAHEFPREALEDLCAAIVHGLEK